MTEPDDRTAAERCVLGYLEEMEARQLEAAEARLAPGVRIIFPGAREHSGPRDIVEAARERYKAIRKTIERCESAPTTEGIAVYVIGTLSGVNLHGTEFSGIRYIDRFIVREGRIVSQEVWNDLAETGVLERPD